MGLDREDLVYPTHCDTMTRVTEIMQERDGRVHSIYLDFSKAFDKVPHERLIWKLQHIVGISETLLHWVKDFLKGRQMRTVIRGTASQNREVTSGVPQGSVLTPIMFLVYVNGLGENLFKNSYSYRHVCRRCQNP